SLNPAIVGKSAEHIAKLAGLSIPPGTRCLIADVGGVGRDYPLSMEKLSPVLAFYVMDGIEQGAARCFEVLSYGGMGHTAGVHTRSRDAAVRYGREMPASRVIVNSPTTHGAIGFSTGLPPSMTLGCGSWGGNVTSDNVSPLHLMDIKRVAFETRPVKSARPAVTAQQPAASATQPALAASPAASSQRAVGREEIAAIVDRFLAGRGGRHAELHPTSSPAPAQPTIDVEAGSMYAQPAAAPHAEAAPTAIETNGGNGGSARSAAPPSQPAAPPAAPAPPSAPQANGNARKPVDFVSEDDVRRAIQKGEKIYVNARTIITPSARDLGDPAEVFAKA
ncbi:MAG TPA: hypothetical protein VJT74_12140, partial [Pyrinomonadaceae bacterium]|nr:hypothetical protein [Pyrinomonadaceae bacterium]